MTFSPTTVTTVPVEMPVEADVHRDVLREIGQRRKALKLASKELGTDTKKAVRAARPHLTATEIAALVDVDRTGIYKTYGQ